MVFRLAKQQSSLDTARVDTYHNINIFSPFLPSPFGVRIIIIRKVLWGVAARGPVAGRSSCARKGWGQEGGAAGVPVGVFEALLHLRRK